MHGTAQVWEQYPQRVTAIEPSDAMIKLAADLHQAQRAQQPATSTTYSIQWHRQLHPSMLPTRRSKAQQTGRQTYDLVVASYVLTEMQSDAARQQAVDMLWRQTKDVLVLLEPGTPSGSAYVRHARTQVGALSVLMRWGGMGGGVTDGLLLSACSSGSTSYMQLCCT